MRYFTNNSDNLAAVRTVPDQYKKMITFSHLNHLTCVSDDRGGFRFPVPAMLIRPFDLGQQILDKIIQNNGNEEYKQIGDGITE